MVSRSEAATAYRDLPVGTRTTLPWWQRGRLHVGGLVIRTRLNDIASRNGTTVVAADEFKRRDGSGKWFLVVGSRLKRLPMQTRTDQPLVSANGRWLAWLEVRAPRTQAYRRVERYRVVVYDVQRQRVANWFRDRRLVEWEDGINGIWLRTLSNHGRLVLSQGSDGVKVLSPRGRPVRFGGPHIGNGVFLDGWPRGTTIFRSGTGTSVYGTLGRDGDFDRAGRFAISFSGEWSADGSGYTYADYDSESTTYWVRPLEAKAVQLVTPVDVVDFHVVGWESPDAVMLWYFDDYSSTPVSRLVRCSTTTGACERVRGGPKAGAPATMPSLF